jgi:hypothetical protein
MPVLVAWNQANNLLQPIIKLGDFMKAGRGNNNNNNNNNNTDHQLVPYV